MTLREAFRGYYPPTEEELAHLWRHGTIVLDTNVLLNLYKFPRAARQDMFAVLEAARDRLWLPHQVALEYHRQRPSVIETQLAVFEKVKAILGFNRIKTQLDALQLRKFHSLISVDGVLATLQPTLDEFEAGLSTLEDEHVKTTGADAIRDQLQSLFAENIGSAFGSQELTKIYEEGSDRYQRRIPPGYGDEKEKSKRPDFAHDGLTYRPMFGDLILWKQIIRYAKENGRRHLLLVSDDEKSDWRQTHEHRGKRLLLPQPELVEEIRREGGVEVFYIYSSESFLAVAKERLGVEIQDATVPQVTDVKEATRSNEDPRWTDPALSLVAVTGREVNRRDATLTCGHCSVSEIPIHFYEGDGTPKLLDVLGVFHYWDCPAQREPAPVNILLLADDRDPELVTWIPSSRKTRD